MFFFFIDFCGLLVLAAADVQFPTKRPIAGYLPFAGPAQWRFQISSPSYIMTSVAVTVTIPREISSRSLLQSYCGCRLSFVMHFVDADNVVKLCV